METRTNDDVGNGGLRTELRILIAELLPVTNLRALACTSRAWKDAMQELSLAYSLRCEQLGCCPPATFDQIHLAREIDARQAALEAHMLLGCKLDGPQTMDEVDGVRATLHGTALPPYMIGRRSLTKASPSAELSRADEGMVQMTEAELTRCARDAEYVIVGLQGAPSSAWGLPANRISQLPKRCTWACRKPELEPGEQCPCVVQRMAAIRRAGGIFIHDQYWNPPPSKPMTAYMKYWKEARAAADPGAPTFKLMMQIDQAWKDLCDEEKRGYEAKAAEQELEYKQHLLEAGHDEVLQGDQPGIGFEVAHIQSILQEAMRDANPGDAPLDQYVCFGGPCYRNPVHSFMAMHMETPESQPGFALFKGMHLLGLNQLVHIHFHEITLLVLKLSPVVLWDD